MATFFRLLLGYMRDCFRSHERLKAEILILRHQLNILHRKAPKRLRLSGGDRALFVWLYRRFPDIGNATAIVRPDTIIRCHRVGFRAWWREAFPWDTVPGFIIRDNDGAYGEAFTRRLRAM